MLLACDQTEYCGSLTLSYHWNLSICLINNILFDYSFFGNSICTFIYLSFCKISEHKLDRITSKRSRHVSYPNMLPGVSYYKTKVKWRRFITWMNMHENPIIKHSISLRKFDRVFANLIIKHLNSSKTLK